MKLFEFLDQHEGDIIQLCRDKVRAASESKPTSALLDRGLPIFYRELIGVLERTANSPKKNGNASRNRITEGGATAHGKESLRLGYTISQVVHAYGAVCQSVTEFVQTKGFKIESAEFHDLNLALDSAIAEAVTEFSRMQSANNGDLGETKRLGFFIHEMASSLAAASIAHRMIQEGRVGSSGATSNLLSEAFGRMRYLIDSSLAEIRMGEQAAADKTPMRLIDVLSEVETSTLIMENSKGVHLELDVDPSIRLTADRHLVFSAASNLVNNAMKFTKEHGHVSVRGKASGGRILIEVEDECGGLSEGKTEELFKPFVQKGTDKTGMGLGLSLSRRAIELNQGKLTARNISDKGCVFTIDLPKDEEMVRTTA